MAIFVVYLGSSLPMKVRMGGLWEPCQPGKQTLISQPSKRHYFLKARLLDRTL